MRMEDLPGVDEQATRRASTNILDDILAARKTMMRDFRSRVELYYLKGEPLESAPQPIRWPINDSLPRLDSTLFGIPVQVSDALPLTPDHKEDARRIVRHGMKDVLEWLGQEVGPEPGAEVQAILTDGTPGGTTMIVSREFDLSLRRTVP